MTAFFSFEVGSNYSSSFMAIALLTNLYTVALSGIYLKNGLSIGSLITTISSRSGLFLPTRFLAADLLAEADTDLPFIFRCGDSFFPGAFFTYFTVKPVCVNIFYIKFVFSLVNSISK